MISPKVSLKSTKKDILGNPDLFNSDNNSEGIGTDNSIYFLLNGTNCIVRHDISYGYGNDYDPLGFYNFSASPIGAYSCKVVGLLDNLSENRKGINFEVSRFNQLHVLSSFTNNFEKTAEKLIKFCKLKN